MSIRSLIARWLDPKTARKAERYERLAFDLSDHHWLGEFPDAQDAFRFLLERDANLWRPLNTPAIGNMPGRIDSFREHLRRRRDNAAAMVGNDPTKPEDFIWAWWAETGTAGIGDGCNMPFWRREDAIDYVRSYGGYIAPLFHRRQKEP